MPLDYDGRLRARRAGGVVAPLVLLPLAAWVWVSAPAAPPTDAASRSSAGAPSTASPSAPRQDASSPGAPSPSASTAGTTSAGDYPPSAPSGDGEPTSVVVTATAAADGSFHVVEEVSFAAPTTSLLLRLPPVDGAGPDFEDVVPVVDDLRVGGTGDARSAPGAVAAPVALDGPVLSVRMTYRWWGTDVATRPSPPGRALAALAPLTDAGDAPVTFVVDGEPARNIACPLVLGVGLGCAAERDGALTTAAPLDAATALVLVQLDVP